MMTILSLSLIQPMCLYHTWLASLVDTIAWTGDFTSWRYDTVPPYPSIRPPVLTSHVPVPEYRNSSPIRWHPGTFIPSFLMLPSEKSCDKQEVVWKQRFTVHWEVFIHVLSQTTSQSWFCTVSYTSFPSSRTSAVQFSHHELSLLGKKPPNNRITEWPSLEGTSGNNLVHPLSSSRMT